MGSKWPTDDARQFWEGWYESERRYWDGVGDQRRQMLTNGDENDAIHSWLVLRAEDDDV